MVKGPFSAVWGGFSMAADRRRGVPHHVGQVAPAAEWQGNSVLHINVFHDIFTAYKMHSFNDFIQVFF